MARWSIVSFAVLLAVSPLLQWAAPADAGAACGWTCYADPGAARAAELAWHRGSTAGVALAPVTAVAIWLVAAALASAALARRRIGPVVAAAPAVVVLLVLDAWRTTAGLDTALLRADDLLVRPVSGVGVSVALAGATGLLLLCAAPRVRAWPSGRRPSGAREASGASGAA